MEPTSITTTDDGRYGAFTTGDGDVVVYDTDNPDAWLQSTYTVEVGPPSGQTS
jgi:hypothetical protein